MAPIPSTHNDSKITATLADGKTLTKRVDYPRGNAKNRLKDEGKRSTEYDLTKEMRRMPLSAVVGVFNKYHVILIFHYLP